MNKADLARACAGKLGGQVAARDAIEVIFDAIVRELAHGGRVALTGVGVWEVVKRADRTGRNPQTGETVKIPARPTVKFRPAPALAGYVRDPGSLPAGFAAGRAKTSTRRSA